MIAATRALVLLPQRPSRRERLAEEQKKPSGELVIVAAETPKAEAPRQPQRPSAAFLAQLIATDRKFPQTRVRNRVEPHEAVAAYGAAANLARRMAA